MLTRLAPPLVLLLLAACADEDTALRLKLVVDPQVNSEAQVLAVVDTIQLIFDAPGGFAALPEAGAELTARNVDTDADLELVLTRKVAGLESFPLYRLLPGSNLDRPFYLTARGMVGDQIAAVGGSALAQFSPGQSLELTVPLNLRPGFRAPRVVMSLPHDGQQAVPQALSSVYLEFSRWISGNGIEQHLRLLHRAGTTERVVPGSWKLVNISVTEQGFPEERTAATFQRAAGCYLAGGEFRIEAGAGITDVSGNALDQDALQPGASAFRSTFFVISSAVAPPGASASEPCLDVSKISPPSCRGDPDCNPQGGTQFICLTPEAEGLPGNCVPSSQSCGACEPGFVCASGEAVKPFPSSSDAELAPQAACVQDCRIFLGCPSYMRCDFGSGLCKPCLPPPPLPPSSDTAPPAVCPLPCPGVAAGCPAQTYCDAAAGACRSCPPLEKACF